MNKLIYLLGVLQCFALACTQEVELDIEGQDSKIVLNGVLMEDSVLRVHLTESRFVLDVNPLSSIPNASLQLYENGTAIGSWRYIENGVYEAINIKPVAGREYKLQVKAPGKATVQADVVMPKKFTEAELLSVDVVKGSSGEDVKVRVRISDQAETQDFYLINLVVATKSADPQFPGWQGHQLARISSSATGVFSTCAEEWDWDDTGCKVLLSDNVFEGRSKELLLNFNTWNWEQNTHDAFYLVVSRVSEAYYKYMLSLYHNQLTRDNPFAEPVPVFMNVSGGYGILGSSSSVWLPLR